MNRKQLDEIIRRIIKEESVIDKKSDYQSKNTTEISREFEKKFQNLLSNYILALEYSRGKGINKIRPIFEKKLRLFLFDLTQQIPR